MGSELHSFVDSVHIVGRLEKIKIHMWGGFVAVIMAVIVDRGGQILQLYTFSDLLIPFFGCSLFYKIGPIFTMGVLFVQYVPENKWMQVLHILAFSSLFLLLEELLRMADVAKYVNWSSLASFVTNVFAFVFLTWAVLVFLRGKHTVK